MCQFVVVFCFVFFFVFCFLNKSIKLDNNFLHQLSLFCSNFNYIKLICANKKIENEKKKFSNSIVLDHHFPVAKIFYFTIEIMLIVKLSNGDSDCDS